MRESSKSLENPAPIVGAPDAETPEAAKARLYQHHKRDGRLGVFDLLYGKSTGGGRDEARQSVHDALQQDSEARGHEPARRQRERSTGRER